MLGAAKHLACTAEILRFAQDDAGSGWTRASAWRLVANDTRRGKASVVAGQATGAGNRQSGKIGLDIQFVPTKNER
jgi:hypothetical protein